MPRYAYKCSACGGTSTIQHLSTESPEDCPLCKSTSALVKLLTPFHTKPVKDTKAKVGQVTEEFIQDARRELKQQKNELGENT